MSDLNIFGFFGDADGKLISLDDKYVEDSDYGKVEIDKPLCIEIMEIAYGKLGDWGKRAEILVSSWAKQGGQAKSGVRAVNSMRKDIPKNNAFFSNLGGQEYGHNLIFYTPTYSGQTVRLTLELLEIDKDISKESIAALTNITGQLGGLPIFAPQLFIFANLGNIFEIGRKVFNMINNNDRIFKTDLDFNFNKPHLKTIRAGRYVLTGDKRKDNKPFVEQDFIDKFTLHNNRLKDATGNSPESQGYISPYVVITVSTEVRKEYENFELSQEAQDILDKVLDKPSADVFEIVSDGVKAVKQGDLTKVIIRLAKKLKTETDPAKIEAIKAEIAKALAKLDEDTADLLKEVLGL
jgi:hypothetical protein